MFIGGAVMFVGGAVTFIGRAVMFVGKGSSAVGRSFGAAGAELYCCWAGCGGSYELGCCGSLALVKGEGEASRACAGGAYADGACVGGACADEAYVDGVCADRACADGACADGACADGACAGGACVDGAVTFTGKGSLAVGRSFKTAKAGVADDIRVNRRNLRRQLITYELKVPLLLIYS